MASGSSCPNRVRGTCTPYPRGTTRGISRTSQHRSTLATDSQLDLDDFSVLILAAVPDYFIQYWFNSESGISHSLLDQLRNAGTAVL